MNRAQARKRIMQADTVHRVASELGIIGSTRWPLMTLVIPLVEESLLETGCLNSYLTDGERVEDLREFRDLVNAIADDYLPVNRPTADDAEREPFQADR